MKSKTQYAGKPKKKVNPGKESRGKIKIKETKLNQELSAGSHKLNALQKHVGIVKPKKARGLEKIEKWIKRRNYGELANKGK
jgi:hypothetical protein